MFEAKLIRFGQSWLDLVDIWANLGEIWADLIRFGQNQNLASSKKFDLLRSFIPRQYSWVDRHEHEHRK